MRYGGIWLIRASAFMNVGRIIAAGSSRGPDRSASGMFVLSCMPHTRSPSICRDQETAGSPDRARGPVHFAIRRDRDGGHIAIFYHASAAIAVPHSGHVFFDARRSYPHVWQHPGFTVRRSRCQRRAVGMAARVKGIQSGTTTSFVLDNRIVGNEEKPSVLCHAFGGATSSSSSDRASLLRCVAVSSPKRPRREKALPNGVNRMLGRTMLATHTAIITTHTASPTHFATRRSRDGGSGGGISIFYRRSGGMAWRHRRAGHRFGTNILAPDGATECSHGWSPGPPGRNPWDAELRRPPRSGRRKRVLLVDATPMESPRPLRGRHVIHRIDHHGFRSCRSALASPAATVLSPYGAAESFADAVLSAALPGHAVFSSVDCIGTVVPHSGHIFFDARRSYPHVWQWPRGMRRRSRYQWIP